MKSIRMNAAYKFMLSFFNVAIPMMMVPYLFRVLGPERFGQIEFSQSIFGYFFVVASLGLYSYGMREVSAVRDDQKKASKLFSELFVISVFSNIIGLIAFVCFVLIRPNAGDITSIMYVLAFNFLANIFLIEWVNESLENYGFIAVKTVVIRIIFFIIILMLIKHSTDFLYYVAINAAYALVNNAASYFYIRKRVNFTFTGLSLKRHIKPLLLIAVMTNGWVLYGQLDKTFLGAYSSMTQVAFYSSAGKVVDILFPLLMSVTAVSTPRLAYYLQNNKAQYNILIKKISSFSMFIIIPAAAGIFLLSDEIMLILGADKFAAASPVLRVFAVYMIILTIERVYTHNVLFVHRKEKALNVMIVSFGVMNAIAKILLIPFLSGVVAISSTLVFHTLLTVVQHHAVKRRLKIDAGLFRWKNFRYLITALFFIPIVLLVKRYSGNIFLRAAGGAALCSCFYFGIHLMMKDENALAVRKMIFDGKNRFLRMARR